MEPVEPPEELCCPILRALFRDPVINCAGQTYERSAAEAALAAAARHGRPSRDPLTNSLLGTEALFTNWAVRKTVSAWLAAHPSFTPEGWPTRELAAAVPFPAPALPAEDEDDSDEDDSDDEAADADFAAGLGLGSFGALAASMDERFVEDVTARHSPRPPTRLR